MLGRRLGKWIMPQIPSPRKLRQAIGMLNIGPLFYELGIPLLCVYEQLEYCSTLDTIAEKMEKKIYRQKK
jgi:hypothetical protein